MTAEQIAAISSGFVLILGGIGTLIVKVREVHVLVNNKYTQVLEVIAKQAKIISLLTGSDGDIALAKKAEEDHTANVKGT